MRRLLRSCAWHRRARACDDPLDAQNLMQEVRCGSADCLALKCSSQGLVYFTNIFYRFDGGRTRARTVDPLIKRNRVSGGMEARAALPDVTTQGGEVERP